MIFLSSLNKHRSKNFNGNYNPQAGFTILEILVVFTLTALITGAGFLSFSDYSRHQLVDQAAATIKETFQKARYNAISQVKLSDTATCPKLYGYSVTVNPGSSTLTINQLCIVAGSVTPITDKEEVVQLSDKITLDAPYQCPTQIRFATLNNTITYVNTPPASYSLPCNFIISGDVSKTIILEKNGVVNIN